LKRRKAETKIQIERSYREAKALLLTHKEFRERFHAEFGCDSRRVLRQSFWVGGYFVVVTIAFLDRVSSSI